MKVKNILSVFDGISIAQLAINRAGIKYEKYYASEIDKNAITITSKHFPETVHLGDITELTPVKLKQLNLIGNVDIYIGGSPCTSLSCAASQKESGLEKGQSILFWEYVRILNIVKPKFFILENVASMKKADKETITKVLGVEPVLINSALVSAQSRKRLYWTNIKGITQPEDKGIYLKDILVDGYIERDKSYCIMATTNKACMQDYLRGQRQMIFTKPVRIGTIGKGAQGERIYSVNGKSITLSANSGGGGATTGLYRIGDIRKLYPIECERLQTIPDNYTEGFSNSARYKMLGNSFTTDIIAHILSFIKLNRNISTRVKLDEKYKQISMTF